MKLGVSTASLYPLETELALEKIGEMGIKNTEIFFNALSELKPSFVDILSDTAKNYGINISAVHPTMSLAESFMIFSAYERRFYEALDQFARYSEIAAELGAKYIIMHGGKPNGILSDEEYCERYMALNRQTLKNGVWVLQENVVHHRSGDIEFLRSMQDILGDDARFCLDIKQSVRSGFDPMELVKEFSANAYHYHLSDHSLAGDCLLPLNGNFDFKGFFDYLKSINYGGSAIVEVYSSIYKCYSEITDSYKKLQNLL
jgi:sugar phosphate isomerase/epimerase